jgi:hypothetical protein
VKRELVQKKRFVIVGTISLFLVALAIYSLLQIGLIGQLIGPERKVPEPGNTSGTLEGKVHYSGLPCAPQRTVVPPCDGPYSDYQIVVYSSDGTTMVTRTTTDKDGTYRITLDQGTYITPVLIPVKVSVEAGKTTVLNFTVSTGIQ